MPRSRAQVKASFATLMGKARYGGWKKGYKRRTGDWR